MTLESLLAFLHLSAILAVVVFLTSEAAICRAEWMNAAVVERLVTVDRIYGIAAVAVLLTGAVRIYFGIKGQGFYWTNWLLYSKLILFALAAGLSIPPTRSFLRWRRELRASGALPAPQEVSRVRRLVMVQAHIVPLIPLPAVFLARGYGSF